MSFISDFISGFKEYVTQTWKNRPSTETPMSAERLNHIESGIKSISDAIKSMASAIMKDMADLTIGASDWNAAEGEPGYVQNRTHWKEYVSKQETILEETNVSFSSNMTSLYGIGTDTVAAGKPYIVHWNDTVYECTAFYASQSTFLGNGALTSSGDDTGEPFCMEMLSATSAFVMKATKDAETIKIKVETPEVVKVHKMDKMYMPDDYEGGGASTFIVNVTSENDPCVADKTFSEMVEAYNDGKEIVVFYKNYPYILMNCTRSTDAISEMRFIRFYVNNMSDTMLHADTILFDDDGSITPYTWTYNFGKNPDSYLSETSTNAVQNMAVARRFNEMEENFGNVIEEVTKSSESVINSIMTSSSGDLTVVKDESKKFEYAPGLVLYKCSDSTPTYVEMLKGGTITLTNGFEIPFGGDSGNGSIVDMGDVVMAIVDEIPFIMSNLEDYVEEGITISKGFYVVIDLDEGRTVDKISINGYSFGKPTINPKLIPDMYYTETGGSVILPETQAVGEGDELTIVETISGVTLGETYTVTYNGVPFECVAEEFELEGVLFTVFGDVGAMTGEPSGEYQFLILIVPEELASSMGAGAAVMPLDGATSVTISISKTGGEVIHKIPKKYVDVVTKYYFSGGLLYHDEEATQTVSNAELRTAFDSGNVLFVQPNLGYKSKCSYHAIEYQDNADIVESYVILAMYDSASEKVQYVQVYATL